MPAGIARAFVNAVQNQDWTLVAGFIHPAEQKELGLTPERVKLIGEKLIAPIQKSFGNSVKLKRVKNPFADVPEEEIYFRNIYFFRLLREGKEGPMLIVVKTEEGWRVNFSVFVYTLLIEATEKGKLRRDWALASLRQVGILRLFVGKESMPLLFK